MRFKRAVIIWAANAAALFAADQLVDGVEFAPEWRVLTAAILFAIFNSLVKPILKALAAPVIIPTLGIGLFLVNVATLYLVSLISTGFDINTYNGAARTTVPAPRIREHSR